MNVFACHLHKPKTKVFFWPLQANSDEFHIINCTANGDNATLASGNEYSEQQLDSLKASYPKVFSEPKYPIW